MTEKSGAPAPTGEMDAPASRPRSVAALAGIGVAALAMFSGFMALGVWQLERREWKHALIAKVEARIHAAPLPPPRPIDWPSITEERDAYTRVHLTGTFDSSRETFVQAVTELGGGFWVLTPLRTTEGFTVLVNRGFVPPDKRDPATRKAPPSPTAVTGLLRITEPGGAYLRDNEPVKDLWRSRDVAAIAERRGLTNVAPYFVDAGPTPNSGGYPVGGLTVVRFTDNHMVYALTWFGLALMVLGGLAILARHELRLRRGTA